jgi:hypothetical protein
MLRRVVIACLAACFAAPAAHAATPTTLMPGVTYDREVTFTQHGPVVVHVITAPRPGGLYDVHPEISNGAVAGLEKLTALEKRVSTGATVAGVSGDEQPSGLYLRGGVLGSPPLSGQSSVGFDAAGNLHVDKVAFLATWAGGGARHPGLRLNQAPPANGVSLFTPLWGAATPAVAGTVEAVIQQLPALVSNGDESGTVSEVRQNGGTAIPAGGAVLAARGTAAATLTAEAKPGTSVSIRLLLGSDWTQVVNGMGGGPLLVRNGRAVFRAGEQFSIDQLGIRQARTAVGQRADGSVVLVAVDGGQAGYSSGLTNFELAQTLVRLKAVTAAGLSIGNAAAMAFDGRLLSRPSAPGGERTVADALLVSYSGVQALAEPVVSPNGDGVAELQPLAYKLARPSTVTAVLQGPGGTVQVAAGEARAPGTYSISFPGTGLPSPVEGAWRWTVTAVDDTGRTSTAERTFAVNDTLGYLTVPTTAARGARIPVSFRLARPARVTVSVARAGRTVRTLLAAARRGAGTVSVSWDGRDAKHALVRAGAYRVNVVAANELGSVSLAAGVRVGA